MSAAPTDYLEPMGPLIAAYVRKHLGHIASEDLTTKRWLIFEKLITLSFQAGRSVARVPGQKWLSVITGLDEGDVSNAVKELIKLRMLERWRAQDGYCYRILPHADDWSVRWRQPDPEVRRKAVATEAWLFELNQAPPQQQPLELSVELPSLDDALADVSREYVIADEASACSGVAAPARMPPVGIPCSPRVPSSANNNHGDISLGTKVTTFKRRSNSPVGEVRTSDLSGSSATSSIASVSKTNATISKASEEEHLAYAAKFQEYREKSRLGIYPSSEAASSGTPEIEIGHAAQEGWSSSQVASAEAGIKGSVEPMSRPNSEISWPSDQLPPCQESIKAKAKLAVQPTARVSASDVPEHLNHPNTLATKLTSGVHPDKSDVCGLHEKSDGRRRPAQEWTGDLRADLRSAMGEAGWAQYRTLWEKLIVTDRDTVREVLVDYRLRASNTRASRVVLPGAWMRQQFCARSKAWKEQHSIGDRGSASVKVAIGTLS